MCYFQPCLDKGWLNMAQPPVDCLGESLQVWLKNSPGQPWWFDLGPVYATWPMVVPAVNESWRRVNEQHKVDGCSIYERISTLSCCINVHIWDYLCVEDRPRFPTTSILIYHLIPSLKPRSPCSCRALVIVINLSQLSYNSIRFHLSDRFRR